MTLQQAALLLAYACLSTLIAAAEPAHVHEARQGPISTLPLTEGPGPVSLKTTSTSSTTTMSLTQSSEPSPSPSSSVSPTTPSASSSSGPSASPSSSETSSATPQPSSSPASLTFTVKNMTTCTSDLISWHYSGPEADLLLSITNVGVDQYYALPRVRARQDTLNTTIEQQLADTNTSALSWTWSSVNITQGWYRIQGLILTSPTVNSISDPFLISNGTDVSCLTGVSPSTVSPAASASPASSASETNTSSVVGTVAGTVVGIAFAVLAGVLLWSRKRKRWFPGDSESNNRKWGSLKSTTSSIQPGSQFGGNHFHSHSDSTGAMIQAVAGGKASATSTPGGSDEDVTVVVLGEEKPISPVSSSGLSPVDALNTPLRYDRRTSMNSVQAPTAVQNDASRSRVASLHTSNQSLEQQAQRIRSSMETSIRRRSERLSMPTLPSPSLSRLGHSHAHTQSKEEYPLTPVTPTPINRSFSAGTVSTTVPVRRTSRKPVPQYDSVPEDTKGDSVSTFTGGAESSQSHGTGMLAGAHGTPPDLAHNPSFVNGRPVHYLIPDMPPPQQD